MVYEPVENVSGKLRMVFIRDFHKAGLMKKLAQIITILACSFAFSTAAYAHCGSCGTGDTPKHDCKTQCKDSKTKKDCMKKCKDHNKKEKKK